MAQYLVTGATGFIGQAITKHLEAQGSKVIPCPRPLLYNRQKLTDYLESINPGYIVHLAAYGNKYNQTDDQQIIDANLITTINLLYASQQIHYKAFVNVGSSSEYGTKKKPMKETDSLDTETFYGATKAASTLICKAFALKHNKPVVTVRPFSVYGPGDDPEKFILQALKHFKNGTPLPLASGVHDWIYIEDFIEGLMTVIEHAPRLRGRVVNIGTGIQNSNHAVVSVLKQILGLPIQTQLTFKMRNYDTSLSWVADNSLLKSLGWKPKHTLEEGLSRIIYGKAGY